MSQERKCRVCGCGDNHACVTEGVPCRWVEEDLCSACATKGLDYTPEDIKAIKKHPGIVLKLSAVQMIQLLGALQLACRHPGFQGPTRELVEELGHVLQEAASVTTNVGKLLALGWNEAYDVPVEKRRIILPRGRSSGE